ncbi:MAG: ISAs1 family transposase [Candidatus Hadarchaeum sp.]
MGLKVVKGEDPLPAIALDGKMWRGSRQQGAEAWHVLSAVVRGSGLTLVQIPVDGKTNEIPLALVLLERLRLEGQVATGDALLTQKTLAQAIVEKGGPIS